MPAEGACPASPDTTGRWTLLSVVGSSVPVMSASGLAANSTVVVLRAYRYALDPTTAQRAHLARSAGTSRWAFNHALAAKVASHQVWRTQVDQLVAAGVDEAAARTQVKVPTPSAFTVKAAWAVVRVDETRDVDGVCPWWREVGTRVFESAFTDADAAWRNWLESLSGRRAGRRVGYPRFKKKGRARDSFRVHHDVKAPGIRLIGYRRLLLPKIGEVRLHSTGKTLARLVGHGQAVVQSVTVSRAGTRWYASVLCKVVQPGQAPTRAQRARGAVGVDLGVNTLAALSTGELVANPRHLRKARRRLTLAQRALSRTMKGSARRGRARLVVARRHHQVAEQRATALHTLTKRLATSWSTVAVEDLNVSGMTRSARGTLDKPGTQVRQKGGLNRSLADAAFGELRRQLEYKTRWYGSRLVLADRWASTSKTCSACSWRNPNQTLSERTFTCQRCDLVLDRDHNAARNIVAAALDPAAWHTAVAPGTGETKTARRGDVRRGNRAGQSPVTREDTTVIVPLVPPQRSDPLTSHPPRKRWSASRPSSGARDDPPTPARTSVG